MKKLKIAVMGLGAYGRGWAYVAAKNPAAELVAVIDRSEDALNAVDLPAGKYTDLDAAIEEAKPEAVVLVVPPRLHIMIAEKLVKQGIAVLCEKPICEELPEAEDFLKLCVAENHVCSIAENFRYRPVFREAKRMLLEGAVGKLLRVNCRYVSYHPDASNAYHGALKHPLLCDVTVHHLDVARYLTGGEPETVFCTEHSAPHTWYGDRPASAEISSEMTNGIYFTYSGTTASPVSVTDSFGEWELIGEKAVMRISGTSVTLYTAQNEKAIWEFSDRGDTREPLLDGFVRTVLENTVGESDIRDNFKSFRWTQKAMESAEKREKLTL